MTKEEKQEYNRKYYLNHREHVITQNAEYAQRIKETDPDRFYRWCRTANQKYEVTHRQERRSSKRELYKLHINKEKERRRRRFLERTYRLSSEQYDWLVKEQNGVCYLCQKPSKNRRLSVDHSHKSGKVRALLCNKCNLFIGHIENNLDLVSSALEYLKERS